MTRLDVSLAVESIKVSLMQISVTLWKRLMAMGLHNIQNDLSLHINNDGDSLPAWKGQCPLKKHYHPSKFIPMASSWTILPEFLLPQISDTSENL
jgi:hypothetical protein